MCVTGYSLSIIELNNWLQALLYFPSVFNTERKMKTKVKRDRNVFSRKRVERMGIMPKKLEGPSSLRSISKYFQKLQPPPPNSNNGS